MELWLELRRVLFRSKDGVMELNPSGGEKESLRVPPVLPGRYRATVTIKDRAGNTSSGAADFTLKGIADARITGIPGQVEQDATFIVEGSANPRSTVIAMIEGDGISTYEEKVGADENGNWILPFKNGLKAGKYRLQVKMITADGAESSVSGKSTIRVSWPILRKLGWLIIAILALGLAVLIYFMWHEKKKHKEREAMIRKAAEDLTKKNKAIFEALHEEVEEKISYLDPRICQQMNIEPLRPEIAGEKIKDALDISQDAISKSLNSIVDLTNHK